MLRSSATRSRTEYRTAGQGQLAANAFRLRDDLDQGSFGAELAAHWARRADDFKFDFDRFVTDHRVFPRAPPPAVPNYSVGTRGLPFIDQTVTDGRYRGTGLY
jgi:hypothetical protein